MCHHASEDPVNVEAYHEKSGRDYSELFPVLKGSTSIMLADINNLPAKLIKEFRATSPKPLLKGAFVEESFYIGDDQLDTLIAIGDNKVEIVRVDAPILLEGKQTNELNIIGVSHVVAIKRGNETFIPTLGTFIKSNDILYISVLSTSRDYLKSILGLA
ncbi:MAG: hypothetical protein HGA35_07590 [Erysipelotrichaceae bacterium]|nr:hypothetical protein [Erysipelotrichaceae bacterium]